MTTDKNQVAATSRPEPRTTLQERSRGADLVVVGIGVGASAGDRTALEQLFERMPHASGMAFLVVLGGSAERPIALAEALAGRTSMPIVQVEKPTLARPDHVYVGPPGRHLDIVDGVLQPSEVRAGEHESTQPHLPIDRFLRSLARSCGEHAVGIVLSATGTDGVRGLAEVKAAFGLAMVVDGGALRAGMPPSASATGFADHVLPPAEMPGRLVAYAERLSRCQQAPATDAAIQALRDVVALLRARTGHDFSHYKPATLQRRVERRIHVNRLDGIDAYLRHLDEQPAEVDLLFKELLIGVSSFFRDPEAFEALRGSLAKLVAERPEGQPIRGWVAGCSTGEEAYSIAILLRECMIEATRFFDIQLFATDLDADAVDIARLGVYPPSIADDVSAERLARFFTPEDGFYRVRKEIRDLIVFAQQDVIADPPFTRLDVLACRNVLIYFDADLQKRLLPLFRYALAPGGILFLGASESAGGDELFLPIDKRWRIFRRRGAATGAVFPLQSTTPLAADHVRNDSARRRSTGLAQAVGRVLLRRLVPPSVLVRENGDVVYVHGETGAFLQPAQGPHAGANLLSMARNGLKGLLNGLLRHARIEGKDVVERDVLVEADGRHSRVDIRAVRLSEPETLRGLVLVAFENARDEGAPRKTAPASDLLPDMERELGSVRERYQSTIEELTATNEELQSTNEELQSASEELSTSKEELQSLNEELYTVNDELHANLDALTRANDDMRNLLEGADIATLFLDRNLHIKRFTERLRKIIRLIPSDVGRPIADFESRISYRSFVHDAREVLRTLVTKEVTVSADGGTWYLIRIVPYRTAENVIDGLVVTFVDITALRALQENERRLSSALANSPTSVSVQDRALRYVWAGHSAFGRLHHELMGRTDEELFDSAVSRPLSAVKREVLATGTPARRTICLALGSSHKTYDLYVEPVRDHGGSVDGISCIATELPLIESVSIPIGTNPEVQE